MTAPASSRLPVRKQRDQDDDRKWHAEHEKQN
jgi:hypothetical protein